MKNKFLRFLVIAALLLFALTFIASCGDDAVTEQPQHTHTFVGTWSYDANGHWKAANCGHNDQKAEFSAHIGMAEDHVCDVCGWVSHTFSEAWQHDDAKHWHPADCNNDGHRTGTAAHEGLDDCKCDVCDRVVHKFGEWETVTAATCVEQGSEKRVCERGCGASETRVTATVAHTAGDVTVEVTKAPTCTEGGTYDEVIYCSVCGAEISRTEKTSEPNAHDFSGEWVRTEEKHFKRCACGEISEEGSHEYPEGETACSVCSYSWHNEHTEGDAVIENEKAPTCTAEGSYDEVVYCTVCQAELKRETKVVPTVDHTEGEPVRENEKAPTCTEAGSYDEVTYCTECNAELTRTPVTTEAASGHTYSEQWTKDETGHWHECTCEHALEPKDFGEHVGMEDCVCDVCGYESHNFSDTWIYNEDGHWHIADCGDATHKTEREEHVGMEDCVCDVCGYAGHAYTEEWQHDESHHWHDAACDHKNERSEYEKHDFNGGICKDCGYKDPSDAPVELPIIPA